jgi:hypothetical protein
MQAVIMSYVVTTYSAGSRGGARAVSLKLYVMFNPFNQADEARASPQHRSRLESLTNRPQTFMRNRNDGTKYTLDVSGAVFTSTTPRQWAFDQSDEAAILTAFTAVSEMPLADRSRRVPFH